MNGTKLRQNVCIRRIKVKMRDHNSEFKDTENRKYAYDFDYIHRDFMIKQLSSFFPKGKALEMGCYKGEFTKRLFPFFEDITVIEASDTLTAECESKFKHVKFINNSFENVNLTDKYDAIFLIHTLEHLDDPTLVLRKINQWLTPNGRLFIVVPNGNAPSRQIAVKMGLITHNTSVTEGEYLHGHRRTYILDTLFQVAQDSGLNILHQGGIFFKPFANFQFDKLISTNIIDEKYLEGCYQLGMVYPDLCASIFLICEQGKTNGS
jgi:2-polyprenyl-3-methyl-5-hydroxy-6-metoxy-1,4-benzoquinol methylase